MKSPKSHVCNPKYLKTNILILINKQSIYKLNVFELL